MNARTIVGGPAAITFNGHTYFTEGDISLEPETAARVISSSWHGPVASRHTDRAVRLTFTPLGAVGADGIAPFVPYGPADLGRLVAPATDRDVEVVTAAGVKLTLKAGVVTRVPDLALGPGGGPFGEMSITAMGGLAGKASGAAGSLWASSAAPSFDAALDASSIPTPGYALTLGAGGQSPVVIDSETDFKLSLGMSLEPVRASAYGTVNYRLASIDPRLTFRPIGPDEAGMLALLQLEGAALGSGQTLGLAFSLAPVGGQAGFSFTGADCQLLSGAMAFGQSSHRHGDYQLAPALGASGGALYALAHAAAREGGE